MQNICCKNQYGYYCNPIEFPVLPVWRLLWHGKKRENDRHELNSVSYGRGVFVPLNEFLAGAKLCFFFVVVYNIVVLS